MKKYLKYFGLFIINIVLPVFLNLIAGAYTNWFSIWWFSKIKDTSIYNYHCVILICVVLASGLIGYFICDIVGSCSAYRRSKRNSHNSNEDLGIHFLNEEENFSNIALGVNDICMYTLNSYEMYNITNTLLEQRPDSNIKNLTILVRKKKDETPKDLENLNNIISMWKRWAEKGRIKKLTIIGYDHDPDHYYTILGDKVVITGHVLFDNSKPTDTNVDYTPLVFTNETSVGREAICNFRQHFDNAVEKYRHTGTL